MIHLFCLLIALYAGASLLLPWRVSWKYKIPLMVFIVLISQFFGIMQLIFGGSFFTPDGPVFLVLAGIWLVVVLIEMFVFLVLRDLCQQVYNLIFFRNTEMRKRFPVNESSLVLLIISGVLASMGMYSALKVPEVKKVEVVLDKLPPELDKFTIAAIADLHASSIYRRDFVEKVVERTLAAKPDMIVLPGDMVDGRIDERENDVEPLKKLQAPCGVFAVLGNHDYYSGGSDWLNYYQDTGIKVLRNENCRIDVNGKSLYVAGIGDRAFYQKRFHGNPEVGAFPPEPEQAVKGVELSSPVIVLAHRPETAVEFSRLGADLQISGHTHGGQMRLFDRFVVAPHNNGWVRGLYEVGKMKLYVSPGAGLWNGFPIRIGVPSEITLLVLRSVEAVKAGAK